MIVMKWFMKERILQNFHSEILARKEHDKEEEEEKKKIRQALKPHFKE